MGLALNAPPAGVIEKAALEQPHILFCRGCNEHFASLGPTSPHLLSCGHSICRECAGREALKDLAPRRQP